ncbi:MAG: putative hydroxypyruvate reductase [Alphaproteobacteria bacterium MarineAlpha3_Bin4]|nr:MAG: putative hydroxypyruvate reductase [Alphaproteobacteria bacterium MarineAlpha3_Bin4]
MTVDNPAELLRAMFDAAVAAADPLKCVPPHLPEPPPGRTVAIGAGKGSAAMARAVEDNWPGELSGLVVTRYDYGMACGRIEIVEAAHPVPDAAGRDAAQRMLAIARSLGPDDLCLALISGGASALLTLPATGLTLNDKQELNLQLLRCGAKISEMNCVRKHLSAIKGGRLALAAAPARVVTLMISDVPGDDPGIIGSGPTIADETTFADARVVLERYGIEPPAAVADHLAGAADETPKLDHPVFATAESRLVAVPSVSLEAAAAVARAAGVAPVVLGDALEGEARELAVEHAAMALALKGAAPAPSVLLSGGETTVTVSGAGSGGRNTEYMLGLALALDGAPGIHAIACDTDGIDGSEDNAGASVAPDTIARARAAGLDPSALLERNDTFTLFERLGDLVKTGPTFTNVNDFRAVLVLS